MKIIKILTITFCIILTLSTDIFAIGNIINTAGDWMDTGNTASSEALSTELLKRGAGQLYNLLLAVATATALIVGAFLGIKYMTAGLEEKADVKQSLYPYFISCIVVFGSLGIWKLAVEISKVIL